MKKLSGTETLMILLSAVFILEILFSSRIEKIFETFGLSLKSLMEGNWWVLITSIFLHASPEHLALNLIALFFFGNAVEEKLGTRKMLAVFFLSAIGGELAVISTSLLGLQAFDIPTIGASGGIFGLMGTAMLVKPFEFIIYPYLIPLPIFIIAIFYTISNFSLFLYHIATGSETDISYSAHLGGVLVGMYIGFKENRDRKAILIFLLLLSLVLFPVIWNFLTGIEEFNYIAKITEVVK